MLNLSMDIYARDTEELAEKLESILGYVRRNFVGGPGWGITGEEEPNEEGPTCEHCRATRAEAEEAVLTINGETVTAFLCSACAADLDEHSR